MRFYRVWVLLVERLIHEYVNKLPETAGQQHTQPTGLQKKGNTKAFQDKAEA